MDVEFLEIVMLLLCLIMCLEIGFMFGERYWRKRFDSLVFSSKKKSDSILLPPLPPNVLPSFDEQANGRTEPVHHGKKENVEKFLGV